MNKWRRNGKQMNRVCAFFAIAKWYLRDTVEYTLTWTLRATSLSVILITVKRYLHNVNSLTYLLTYILTNSMGQKFYKQWNKKKGFSVMDTEEYISTVSEDFGVFRLIVSILLNSCLETHQRNKSNVFLIVLLVTKVVVCLQNFIAKLK